MSGKLVGRVLDAAETGHLDELSRAAFHALIAIAERCQHDTAQGYCHMNRIRAAIRTGNSPRSAGRALKELRDAGLVQLLKRGYRLPNGVTRSNFYQLILPGDDGASERVCATISISAADAAAIQDGVNDADAAATHGGVSDGDASAIYGHASAIYGHASAIHGGFIDGKHNGIIDGSGAAAALPASSPGEEEPPRFCSKHPNGTIQNCGPCGTARVKRKQWESEQAAAVYERLKARRRCNLCAGGFWLIKDDGTPIEPAKACPQCKPAMTGTA